MKDAKTVINELFSESETWIDEKYAEGYATACADFGHITDDELYNILFHRKEELCES